MLIFLLCGIFQPVTNPMIWYKYLTLSIFEKLKENELFGSKMFLPFIWDEVNFPVWNLQFPTQGTIFCSATLIFYNLLHLVIICKVAQAQKEMLTSHARLKVNMTTRVKWAADFRTQSTERASPVSLSYLTSIMSVLLLEAYSAHQNWNLKVEENHLFSK